MIEFREGHVIEIIYHREGLTKVKLAIDNKISKAISFDNLVGPIDIDDEVIVNTSATSLQLGTGGYDFIVYILNQEQNLAPQGHIMKLRYSPYQLQTYSLAEQQSSYHRQIKKIDSIAGMPVIVGTLHSMLGAIVAIIKAQNEQLKIGYIMTDAAALPLKLSDLVYKLEQKNLIDLTITIGHAFGGDLEAVNIYSALLGAYLEQIDVVVTTMGPGIVGTGTKYGFSGTEQADVLNAVSNLEGIPIAVPRINFSDARKRHYGLSHHSQTNLGELTLIEALVGIPNFNKDKEKIINQQLEESKICLKHKLIYKDGTEVIEQLQSLDFELSTMGQGLNDVPEYFMTAGIAGVIANEQLY